MRTGGGVTLEYDDGRVEALSGEQARAWIETVNGAYLMAATHGCELPQFVSEEVKPGTRTDLVRVLSNRVTQLKEAERLGFYRGKIAAGMATKKLRQGVRFGIA